VDELKKKEYRLKKLKEAMEVLKNEKIEKVNVTEPDFRLMKDLRRVVQPCYDGQMAVDDKDPMIVAANVSQNATDHAEFKPMAERLREKPWGFA